jgi:threonine synthase
MLWLYGGKLEAVRKNVAGSRHEDAEVLETIKQVFERTGYLLDPHSAIGYLGITTRGGDEDRDRREGIFLATAHPAKFSEIVEPVIGRKIERPAPLEQALARTRQVMKLDATLAAVRGAVGG